MKVNVPLNEIYNGQGRRVLPADILAFSSLEDSTRCGMKMIERFVARLLGSMPTGMEEGNKVKAASRDSMERQK
jgi:hypothetical protein